MSLGLSAMLAMVWGIIHYGDVIMSAMVSQITSLTIVYSGADQRKHQKLCVTGLCEGNSPVAGEFPVRRASNTEHVSIWWRHHVGMINNYPFQVCILDVSPECGQKTAEEFQSQYGKGNATFIQCDVTNKDNLEGRTPFKFKLMMFISPQDALIT